MKKTNPISVRSMVSLGDEKSIGQEESKTEFEEPAPKRYTF